MLAVQHNALVGRCISCTKCKDSPRTVRGQVRACPGKSTAMTTHTASLAGRKEGLPADVKPECLPLSGKHSEAAKSKSSLRRESRPCARADIPRTPVGFPPG